MIIKPPWYTPLNMGLPINRGIAGCWQNQEAAPVLGALHDFSGNGNHGTLVGPHSVPGKFGNALDFDGTNNDGVTMSLPAFAGNDPISILAWINPSNTQEVGIDARFMTSGNIIVMRYQTDNDTIEWLIPELDFDDRAESPNGSITPGMWQQVCGTYDGTVLDLYINGELRDTAVSAGGTYASVTSWEMSGRGGSEYTGLIDHLILYRRALSAGEVLSLYREPFQGFYREPIELWVGSVGAGAPPAGIPILRRRMEAA